LRYQQERQQSSGRSLLAGLYPLQVASAPLTLVILAPRHSASVGTSPVVAVTIQSECVCPCRQGKPARQEILIIEVLLVFIILLTLTRLFAFVVHVRRYSGQSLQQAGPALREGESFQYA
jgi:hypothetical protein